MLTACSNRTAHGGDRFVKRCGVGLEERARQAAQRQDAERRAAADSRRAGLIEWGTTRMHAELTAWAGRLRVTIDSVDEPVFEDEVPYSDARGAAAYHPPQLTARFVCEGTPMRIRYRHAPRTAMPTMAGTYIWVDADGSQDDIRTLADLGRVLERIRNMPAPAPPRRRWFGRS